MDLVRFEPTEYTLNSPQIFFQHNLNITKQYEIQPFYFQS